jgi:hypothetical protein
MPFAIIQTPDYKYQMHDSFFAAWNSAGHEALSAIAGEPGIFQAIRQEHQKPFNSFIGGCNLGFMLH